MKRRAKVCALIVTAFLVIVGSCLAVCKLYSMYENVWNTLDDISESANKIKRETQYLSEATRNIAAQVERFHKDTYFRNGEIQSAFDYSWMNDVPPYIAHACGGIDGKIYTNSREAFLLNYQLGHRVFEIDFNLGQDGFLIACHDENDWRKMTGTDLPYTRENFNRMLIYNQYESLDCTEVIDLMEEYPDIYVVTDTKDDTQEEAMLAFSQLVYYAKQKHPEVLERIIPQIYNEEMLSWISSIYPFKSVIFTLYATSWTPQSVLNFCTNSGIRFITMPVGLVSKEILRLWDTMDIQVAVHTVNDEQHIDELFDMGVDMIYTDFAVPN